MTFLAMENKLKWAHMHAQINRVDGVEEVKMVMKERLDALKGGVQHT